MARWTHRNGKPVCVNWWRAWQRLSAAGAFLGRYFASAQDATAFHDELAHMLLTQKVAFNSPVWFNVGCDRLEPQSAGQNWRWDPGFGRREVLRHRLSQSAVLGLLHQLRRGLARSILTLAKTEGMLFKWGSGTGTNFLDPRSMSRSRAAARPPARSASCAALMPLRA